MKHLLLVTTSYPESGSGNEAAGSFVADVAEELSKTVNISVVAPGLKEYVEKKHDHLTVNFFKVPGLPLSLLSPSSVKSWKDILATLKSGQKAVDDVLAIHSVDHILAFWVVPSGYWARNAFKRYQVPFSCWALGSDIWKMGKIPFIKQIIRKVLQDSRYRMADGIQLKNDVELLCNENCQFMPSTRDFPVVTNKILNEAAPYRLAYLGRWHENKGVDLLLRVLTLLTDRDWDKISEVRICGGGPLEPSVRQFVASLVKAGRPVKLTGYLDKNQAAELFRWADYVLIPSRIESIPVVFSDAMKAMCPVISTPVGDLGSLLTQYNVGICSKKVSISSYRDALCMALDTRPIDYAAGMMEARDAFSLGKICEDLYLLLFGQADKSK